MPINQADDADIAFERGRERDKELLLDDLARQALSPQGDPFGVDALLAEANAGEAPQADPNAPQAAPGAPGAEAAPTAPESPQETPEGEEGEEGLEIFGARDTAVSAVRGPFAELADVIDNLNEPITNALQAIMPDFVHVASAQESFNLPENQKVREAFDEKFGTPETLVGGLAQGTTGQLAYILPAFRAVKGAGALANWGKLTAISAGVAGITQGEDEGNLSNLALQFGEGNALLDNSFTRLLAIDQDDEAWERILKTTVEDVALSFVADVSIEGIKHIARRMRGLRKAAPGIENAAARVGAEVDPDLGKAADELATAKLAEKVADAAVENLETGSKTINESAAFRGVEGEAPDQLDEVVGVVGEAVEKEAKATQTAAKQRVAELESTVEEIANRTTADGRYLEAYRQQLKEITSGKVNQALGDAATRNTPVRPDAPAPVKFNNYLEATEETATMISRAVEADDVEGIEQALGQIYDSTNFDNILDEDGSIGTWLEAHGAVFGNSKLSQRVQTEIGLAQTAEDGARILDEIAADTLGDPERFAGALQNLMPNMKDFRARFNAIRVAEVGMAGKLRAILKRSIAQGGATQMDKAEFVRWSRILANINDMRAGIISEIGGTLSANRIPVDATGFDAILAGAREVVDGKLDEIVASAGGSDRVEELMKLTALAAENGTDSLLSAARKSAHAFTLGDVLYESFIYNILSSPATQAINISSNAVRSLAWDPTSRFFEASARAVIQQDLTGFKALRAHIEGLAAGALGAFKMNDHLGRSQIKEAFVRRSRLTGRRGGLFAEAIPQERLLTSQSLGNLARRGVPVQVPFTKAFGFGGTEGRQVPLLGFLNQSTRNGMVDFMGRHLGPLARIVDYLGHAMGWVGGSLAATDELFAAMSYRAQLYADTVEKAAADGLQGEDAIRAIERMRRHVSDLEGFKQIADARNPQHVAYLKELTELDAGARQYAERATYTSQLPISRSLETFRHYVPMVRWFAPFVRTPLNLAAQGITDFSPLGPAFQAAIAGAEGNPKEVAKALGRFAMIGSIYAGILHLATNEKLTGGGPHNPAQRAIWLLHNKPYSVKINGKWVSYNRFDPLAMPIGMLADALYLMGRQDITQEDSLTQDIIGVLMEATKSRTFLQGITEFLSLFDKETSHAANRVLVSKVHNTFLPGSRMWAAVERGGLPLPADLILGEEDLVEGETETSLLRDFLEGRPERSLIETNKGLVVNIGSSMARDFPPGIQEGFIKVWNSIVDAERQLSIVPDRDFYGDPLVNPPGLGPDFVSPFQIAEAGEDKLSEELARLGYGFSIKSRFGRLYGKDLTIEQRDRFHMLFVKPTPDSKPIKELLQSIVLDEDGELRESWLVRGDPVGNAPGGKRELLDKIIGDRMKIARRLMRAKDETVMQAYIDEKRAKRLARSQKGSDQLRAEALREALE